ncbi:MAG: hypothetical protein KC456_06250 [Flavobacteriales bacterium]|nr:hypothetical protein [Flavobacteriales bacterium]
MKSYYITITLSIALIMGALSLQSCKKEGCMDETATNYDADAEKDDESCEYPPEDEITFAITSPEEHKTFMLGDTIHVSSMFETTAEVHGYSIQIINTSKHDEVVFSAEEAAHESPVHMHAMWVNDVTMHSDMSLKIAVEVDHDGTEEVKTIGFHCMHTM